MVRQMIGSKGGSGGSSFVTKPDTLRSNDSFEILLGLGSGRWKGLVDGLQSFKINGVPLENEDETSNFENVFLIFADGNPLEDQIVTFKLGGGGNAQTVNTQLANSNSSGPGGWVSGAVLTPGANFIDLRFVVQQLFYQDKKGVRENTATIEIEMRPSGTLDWINIFSAPSSSGITYDPSGYDYYDDYGGVNNRIYLSRNMFNSNGIGFKAGNGQGMSIKGKTSSPFVKEMRVSVPNAGDYANKTWEVRARLKEKDTVDADEIQERRNIVFESITAIINEPLGDDPEWDGLVWAQVYGKASDQFNGFPELTGIFDTKICKVPPDTVFNPETREYTNITWDGSYVEAFTTDPAWQIKEFVEDPIHGIAGLYPGATVDKWDALEASKYYSEMVPDGQGGEHPRFSMNLTINEAKDIGEMMQYLAGAVNSYTEEVGEGVWRLKVDKPETPVMVFTEDNIFGDFTYSHSGIDTRFNDWRGTFLDETLDYETNTLRVFDQADIDANGTKFTEIALVGCTHPQEALRRLMYRLRVSLNEYKMVSFTTNRVGRLISPLSTILVADGALNPDHLVKSTSRLHSYAGTNVSLKRAIRLQAGVTYKMKFTTTDLKVVERTITNVAPNLGDVVNLTLNSALPNNIMPESAVALEAVGLAALPVAYRVVGVEKSEDNEDEYNISAVFIDVGKWDAMDNVSADAIAAQESSVSINPPTVPSSGMFNVVEYSTDFQIKKVLQVNWNRPASMFLNGFRLEYRLNNGPWRIGSELLKDSFFELQNPQDGTYEFKIIALDRRGVQSNPLIESYIFDGDALVTPPAHIRGDLAGRPPAGPYDGFRYTVTDGEVPIIYVWNDEYGQWDPESNLITEGSQIGVENGATVGMTPSEAAALADAQAQIADLFATYGDTASASAAAAAAADSANDALNAASAADGSATVASTKRDEAEGFMTVAQASAVTAGDAASVSTSQAAAASTSASSAATSSSLAASYSAGANLAALATLPSTFEQDGTFFCEGTGASLVGSPSSLASVTGAGVYAFETITGIGRVAKTTSASGSQDIAQKGVIAVKPGRKYQASATHSTASGTRTMAIFAMAMDANYASLSGSTVTGFGTATTAWATTSTAVVNGDDLLAAGVAYIRAVARFGASASVGRFSQIKIEDVTESDKAATQAGISTTQAAAATASAAAASTSETLSATYRDTALAAAQAMLPSTFEQGLTFFKGDTSNPPNNHVIGTDVTYGPYIQTVTSTIAGPYLATKGRLPTTNGKKWKVRALMQRVSGGPYPAQVRLEIWSAATGGTRTTVVTNGSQTVASTTPAWIEAIITSTADGFVSPEVLLNYPTPSSVQRCYALEIIDVDASEAATAQATIATTQAAIATSQAAAAQSSYVLSASLGKGYVNANSNFADWPTSGYSSPGSGWTIWNGLGGVTVTRELTSALYSVQPDGSPYCMKSVTTTNTQYTGLISDLIPFTSGNCTLEASAFQAGGTWLGSGLYVVFYAANGSTVTGTGFLAFGLDADVAGVVSTSQLYLRRWSKNFVAPAGTQYARLYCMANYNSGLGTPSAKTIYFFKGGIKPGNATDASVLTHSAVLATHDTKLASWMTSASAGAGYAEIYMNALDVNGDAASQIGFRADEILLGDLTNTVLEVTGGEALFSGNIRAGGGIFVGDSAIPVALQAFDLEVYDGQTVSYGTDLGNIPKLNADFSTFPALTAGQSYVFRADSHTPTGFIARVKKVTASTPTTQTSAAGTNPGSGPTFQAQKPTSADAYDGKYSFTVSGTMYRESEEVYEPPKTIYRGYIDFQTWFRPSGDTAWTAGPVVRVSAGSGTVGNQPYTKTFTANFGSTIGQHGTNTEFGVSIYGTYGVGTNTLTGLGSVSYSTLTGATESTATPSNLPLLPLKVTPQNG